MKKHFILTNNPYLVKMLSETHTIRYEDTGFLEILIAARDLIQKGHKLLSHPLAGNVSLKRMPYKSLLLSEPAAELDAESVVLIENCIHFCEKHPDTRPDFPDSVLEDFQMVDYNLTASAVQNAWQ